MGSVGGREEGGGGESTGEEKNVWACWNPALAECWGNMKGFVAKLSAISVIPQFSILYAALKRLGLCF